MGIHTQLDRRYMKNGTEEVDYEWKKEEKRS